jgi:hypothetical protein
MKTFAISVFWCCVFTLQALAQAEITSPDFSFRLKRDQMELPYLRIDEASVAFIDNDGNYTIDASESCKVRFTLNNKGKGDAANITATLKSGPNDGLNLNVKQQLALLAAGRSYEYEVSFKSDINTIDGNAQLLLEVEEPNGINSNIIPIDIVTRSLRAPDVRIVDFLVSSDAGGDIHQNDRCSFTLMMQNTGPGVATDVSYELKVEDDGNVVYSSPQTGIVPMLQPGEKREIIFDLFVKKTFVAANMKVTLFIKESYGKYSKDWVQSFPVLASSITTAGVKVQAKTVSEQKIEAGSLRSDVDRDIPIGLSVYDKRYAVCIGNQHYKANAQSPTTQVDVDFAINDAMIFAEYAKTTLGVPERNVFLLKDAAKKDIVRTLNQIESFMQLDNGESEIIYYYSGHGLPEEGTSAAYLVPVDFEGSLVTDGFPLSELYQRLSKHPSRKVTVVMDACFSGGARSGELVAMKGIKLVKKENTIPQNLVVLASCKDDQTSSVFREKQHGLFTYFLLKWLKENRGEGKFQDMMKVIHDQVAREAIRSNTAQDPQLLFGPNLDENQQANMGWK